MPDTTIFDDDAGTAVAYNPDDNTPIRLIVEGEGGLYADEAIEAAKAILDALSASGDLVAGDHIVRASDVSFNEGALRLAAAHGRTVEFRYAKGKDGTNIEIRRLVPHEIKPGKDGALIFLGHDPDRDDVRAYRVDRMKGEVHIS
jgi:predicted DNA-binding transcriptional regulator YafY